MRIASAIVLALVLLGGAAGAVPRASAAVIAGPDEGDARRQFLVAMQRVNSPGPEPADSAALQTYIIYDYLVASRLRRDLKLTPGEQLDVAIDGFLQVHTAQPVAHDLRHEWLLNLAERRRWDWFLPRTVNVLDPVLICDRLAARLESGDTNGLGVEALVRWNLPQKQPRECDSVFSWLRQQGLTSAAGAETRTRAALTADNPHLAREFAADLAPAAAAPLLQWAQLLEAPKPVLNALATNANMPVEAEALDAGFNRLARSDSAAALTLLPRLLARPDMTPALRGHLLRDAALGAAYDRNPDAIAALDGVPAEAADDEVWQWRARAALWTGDYDKALTAIVQMPSSLAAQPRWQYWHARTVAATQGSDAAAPLFAAIAGLRDYYGYLAADRLHRDYALNAQPSLDDQATQATLAARPGLVRAHALFDCAMTDEAMAEWANELSDADPAVKLQAAHLAASWGWYAQSVATLAQAGEWNDVRLRYPRPYSEAIAQASALTQIPSDWLLAVMRQESLFRRDAVSRAGARGLMQLRPATAAALERRWRLPDAGPDALFDPTEGTALGAAYLREMLDHFDGQLGPSLAAYNAGPAPVARWLPSHPMDADIWIENIVYGETRDYLQRIFEHIVAYAWVRDAEPPRLVTLLPKVEPAASAARAVPSLGPGEPAPLTPLP
jgi:soluble lytic murein transglycosylase